MLYRREIATCAILALTLLSPALASDGRIEINQAKALAGGVTPGDTAGFPVTISLPGSYILTSDLDVTVAPDPPNTTAILVTSSQGPIALDLNGFAIQGPAVCGAAPPCTNSGSGSGINSFVAGTTVENGTVKGMGDFGLLVLGDVRNVQARHNGGIGIAVNGNIYHCVAEHNGDRGVEFSPGVIESTLIRDNLGGGLNMLGGVARNLSIINNTGATDALVNGRLIDSVVDPGPPYPRPTLDCSTGGGCVLSGCWISGDEGAAVFVSGSMVTQLPFGSNRCGSVLCP